MILAKAPLRISFFGGSSDIPAFYCNYGPGHTVSMTIDKYVYVSVMKTPYNHIKASYSTQETVTDINDLKHDIIRETLKHFDITSNIEITTFADIPTVGTGLGGSSAFTCALVAAMFEYEGFKRVSKYTIAETACHIEIDLCGHNIGKQDQYASAFGGLNHCTYTTDGVTVEAIEDKSIDQYCILIPTLIDRKPAHKVIDSIDFDKNHDDIARLARIAHNVSMSPVSIDIYGETLDLAWKVKKQTSPLITNSFIDKLYTKCKEAGALGCKLLGAGGGGYMLVINPLNVPIVNMFSDRVCILPNISYRGAEVVYCD